MTDRAPRTSARPTLHRELGRLLVLLAEEHDEATRVDLVDEALDVLTVLERLGDGSVLAHPRGLRLIDGGIAA
jgi:hypothetical protein